MFDCLALLVSAIHRNKKQCWENWPPRSSVVQSCAIEAKKGSQHFSRLCFANFASVEDNLWRGGKVGAEGSRSRPAAEPPASRRQARRNPPKVLPPFPLIVVYEYKQITSREKKESVTQNLTRCLQGPANFVLSVLHPQYDCFKNVYAYRVCMCVLDGVCFAHACIHLFMHVCACIYMCEPRTLV